MPRKFTKKPSARKPRRKNVRRKPLKYNANKIGGPNTARVIQTLDTVQLNVNTPYQFQVGGITGNRALAHAEQYGLYRIAKIEFKHKPKYDTFIPGTITVPGVNQITTVPLLYWKMNRFADAPAAWNPQDLRDMGAKPHRFDDKTYSLSYKPNILTAISSGGDNSGQLKMTPWLNTDDASQTPTFAPSDTLHYGHFLYIEADTLNTSTDPAVGSLDVIIHYEFKTPRVRWTPATEGSKLTVNPFTQITH